MLVHRVIQVQRNDAGKKLPAWQELASDLARSCRGEHRRWASLWCAVCWGVGTV